MADNLPYNFKDLGYAEILKRNQQLSKMIEGKELEVEVLSNITVNPLKEVLEFALRSLSLKPAISFGNYDNIVQDSFSVDGAGLIIVFYELVNLTENFSVTAELLEQNELEEIISKCKSDLDIIFENLLVKPFVIFNKFSAAFSANVQVKKNADYIEHELNSYLVNRRPANFYLADINKIINSIGNSNAYDFNKFVKYKSLYKIEFLKYFVSSIENLLLRRTGKLKKVLVFDCDNTLWKGVIGEDGPEGIDMSLKTEVGRNFNLVQQIAVWLSKKGILICLCSKNNIAEVEGLLENHPDMVINQSHLVATRVNWNNKEENLKEIAKELNVGLESLVFIDDSTFEINLIKDRLPEVLAFNVPGNADEYPALVLSIAQRYFNLEPLAEDLQKVKIYKEQAKRVEAMSGITNIDSYLATLGTIITVRKNSKEQIQRIAQLTQKTNQFNLTTQRYTETEILNYVNDPSTCIFTIDVADKFGNSGVTGVLILRETEGKSVVEIDSYLLSCRILGRKIETKFMNYVLQYCKSENYQTVTATYRKTNKNSQVKDFYLNNQFEIVSNSESGTVYVLTLEDYEYSDIDFIQLIEE